MCPRRVGCLSALEFSELEGCAYWRVGKKGGVHWGLPKVARGKATRRDAYEATFESLGITHVLVGSDGVKENRRLLVSSVWCIADLTYQANEAKDESPFILSMPKPSRWPASAWRGAAAHEAFSAQEWVDAVVRTIGFDPAQLSGREKLYQLPCLVTYCKRNYNYVELGPKGTGKNKRPKPDIVDIMKNYMANKSFSRGIEQATAEASTRPGWAGSIPRLSRREPLETCEIGPSRTLRNVRTWLYANPKKRETAR